MTAYVTDRTPAVFWADDLGELWDMAIAAGIDLTTFHDAGSFQFFSLTANDRLRVMREGAKCVDWLEPAFQCAAREGDYSRVVAFMDYRARFGHKWRGRHNT